MRFNEFLMAEEVKKGDFSRGKGQDNPDVEIPVGPNGKKYDRFELEHEEGKSAAKIYGIMGSTRRMVSASSVALARELVKIYNGGKSEHSVKPVTMLQAFGSKEINAFNDAGIKLAEKPDGWNAFEDGAYLAKYAYTELQLRRAEKALGHRLKVYTSKEIFGTSGRPRGMLANADFPAEEMFIVDFGNNDRWIADTTGANTYIRNWAKLKT